MGFFRKRSSRPGWCFFSKDGEDAPVALECCIVAVRSVGDESDVAISYTQYLYGVAIVATIDLDAPDPELVDKDSEKKSSWLLKNCVVLRLKTGETFYKPRDGPAPTLENAASLFAQTVKRRRQ